MVQLLGFFWLAKPRRLDVQLETGESSQSAQVFYASLLLACLRSPAGVITVWSDCSAEVFHSAISIIFFCIHT